MTDYKLKDSRSKSLSEAFVNSFGWLWNWNCDFTTFYGMAPG